MLMWVCSVIDHRWCKNVVQTKDCYIKSSLLCQTCCYGTGNMQYGTFCFMQQFKKENCS